MRKNVSPSLTAEEIVSKATPFPNVLGVYFLINQGEVVYVGQSTNVYSRVRHHANPYGYEFDSWYYIACESGELNWLESYYIHTLQPKHNGWLWVGGKVKPKTAHRGKMAPICEEKFKELLENHG